MNFQHPQKLFITSFIIFIVAVGILGVAFAAQSAYLRSSGNPKLYIDGNAQITGQITIQGGTPAAGQVLTSNASGLATWEPAALSSPVIYSNSAFSSGHFGVGVSCGVGGRVFGGGCFDTCARVAGGPGYTGLVINYPSSVSSWYCSSRDINVSCSRTLRVYAICTQ